MNKVYKPKTFRKNRLLYHIVNEFNDSGNSLHTVKWWSKQKQRWRYEIISAYELSLRLQGDKINCRCVVNEVKNEQST